MLLSLIPFNLKSVVVVVVVVVAAGAAKGDVDDEGGPQPRWPACVAWLLFVRSLKKLFLRRFLIP